MSLALQQLGKQFKEDNQALQCWPELNLWQDIDLPETDIDKGWQQLLTDLFHFSVDQFQPEEKSGFDNSLDQPEFNSKKSNFSIPEVKQSQEVTQLTGIQTQESLNTKTFAENQKEESYSQSFEPMTKKQSIKAGLSSFAQDFSKQINIQSLQTAGRHLNPNSRINAFSKQTKKEPLSTDTKNSFQASKYEYSDLTKKTIKEEESCPPNIEKNLTSEKNRTSEISNNNKDTVTVSKLHNVRKETTTNAEALEPKYNQVQDSEKTFSSSSKKHNTGLSGFAGDFNFHQASTNIKTENISTATNSSYPLAPQSVNKIISQKPKNSSSSLLSNGEDPKDSKPAANLINNFSNGFCEDQTPQSAAFQPYIHQQFEKTTHPPSPEQQNKNLDQPLQTSSDSEEQFTPLSMRFSSSKEKSRPVNGTDLKRQFRRFYRR